MLILKKKNTVQKSQTCNDAPTAAFFLKDAQGHAHLNYTWSN